MTGENPYGDSMTGSHWLIYIFFFIMVIIVALNLLIAILSNTYDGV